MSTLQHTIQWKIFYNNQYLSITMILERYHLHGMIISTKLNSDRIAHKEINVDNRAE